LGNQLDLEAQGLDAADQASSGAYLVAAVAVVRAQLLVGFAALEHVVDRGEHGGGHGNDRLLLAPAAVLDAVERFAAELDRIKKAAPDDGAGHATVELLAIGRHLPRNAEVADAMSALDRRIGEANLAALSGPPPSPPAGSASYVGLRPVRAAATFTIPPGTSKWNKIEHQMFCHITQNWRGHPLTSREVIVNLIAATTTREGLRIQAGLDTGLYPTGVVVSDSQLAAVNLRKARFHGEWNYTIAPRKPS